MQTRTHPGDAVTVVPELALVTALVAPLVKLRAALGDGARPDGRALAAMAAVPATVRASDDTHRAGITHLTSTETATAAVPAMTKTGGEVGALAGVSESLAPLLTSAYDTRDKAADALDTLIADFRAQATPLVKAARSQADLDPVVSLAADYVRDGVGVVKAADGQMDTLTSKVKDISDGSGVSVPAALPTDGGATQPPANTNTQYPNPGATNTQYGTNGQNSYYGYGNNGWNSANNYSGWNSNGSNTQYGGDYTNSTLAQSNPELAAQLTIQSALLSAGVTLGSALITGAVTLGSALIDKGSTVLTTAIEKGETYAEKALAANTSGGGTTPGGTQTGGGVQTGGNSLTPGLADPGPTTPVTDTGGGAQTGGNLTPGLANSGGGQNPQPAQPAQPQAQPQAGAAPDGGGAVVPPITGKPTQPGNDDTSKKRNGQAGTTT
ncbi:hypothetical protein [Nocardia sp. NPDC046763]|uniref:hypothetical protein n=1 Tax=Nocardia sp. NPDC046763 TaxID=3155256 RepID=UPI0033C0F37F